MRQTSGTIFIILVLVQICCIFCFFQPPQQLISKHHLLKRGIVLNARVSGKVEEVEQAGKTEDLITIPFDGLVGREQGSLFDRPLDIFDPLKDTDSLPGEDGSDEKIGAIQNRIVERVAALKLSGQWGDDTDVQGRDPLATQPIWSTMFQQIRICKPFESVDELALTYILLIFTTAFLMVYLILLRETFDTFIIWFTDPDFDSNFLNGLFNQS
jgi:hypothetical protein|mmetsp:Transcript_31118/g.29688  ORF Transcript_31118/g.29688 Transcript_31118/m.29688 type:complete len:213 (-) Transcript_31118:213-851(-)